MKVYRLNHENAEAVAQLMTTSRPIWWPDIQNAYGQLTRVEDSIETVGWLLGEDEAHPQGWFLCRELKGYQTLELECCGYDDGGVFKLEHKLKTLFDTASAYAKAKGYTTFRTGMSTVDFNLDGKALANIPKAMECLETQRVDYHWLLDYGFRVMGIQPNAYGNQCHMILLVKEL